MKQSPYFLLQLDITTDYVGQLDFNLARAYMRKVLHNTNEHFQKHPITMSENIKKSWKLEYSLKYKKMQFIRIKFYVKTEELLTSCGVTTTQTRDPMTFLLNHAKANYNYKRSIFSEDGNVITRLECSFYYSKLLIPSTY